MLWRTKQSQPVIISYPPIGMLIMVGLYRLAENIVCRIHWQRPEDPDTQKGSNSPEERVCLWSLEIAVDLAVTLGNIDQIKQIADWPNIIRGDSFGG